MIEKSINKINYFILTGGPGSGKTAVLNALAQLGFLTVAEVARSIIQHQHDTGGNATHWGDRKAFLELMLAQSIADYKRMQTKQNTVFFDRGLPDLYGYSKGFCDEIELNLMPVIERFGYNKTVFIFPPWLEIYAHDAERKQDFQEAVFTYNLLKEAYIYCDYHVVEVPKSSIKERVDFILKTIS
ncbi:AAA family ATPase [Legionella sp. km772]|uniref:AAA family ATPase n=1 Tax=Legionella sp. km772 TaxID=2498111 RepID=UPI000F8EA2E1|nr:AAA family ATPase [Legionella sp. km772]RUR06904.1 ATPase [Legionella sp. km772]